MRLKTIRAKRIKKPYLVLEFGKYPEIGSTDHGAIPYSSKEAAFDAVRTLNTKFPDSKYWVVEVSFKPLLGR